jgi:hypothetical protein
MAGTTTNFAIPYPSSTDYVTDGATAMRSLAEQVDGVLFTGSSSGNLLINGAMQVTQRSGVGTAVTGITTAGYYTADRWQTLINTMGTFSQTTLADASAGSGFRNCLRLQCTTADASPAAGDYVIVTQKIEGQNLQAIRKGTASAQTLTLSFWVKAFQTGTFIVELQDIDNSRSVSKSYTISASNTWEYKTVTFPADTSGVLDNDNNTSVQLNFWLGAGTTYTSGTLATTWGATVSANRAVGVTNLASSTSNTWFMTGAQLTVGSVAVPFQFKSYGQELHECMRYFQVYPYAQYQEMPVALGYAPANYYYGAQAMRVPYRAAPTVTVTSIQWRNPGTAGLVAGTNAYYNANNDGAYFAFAAASGGYHALSFFIGSTQTAEL